MKIKLYQIDAFTGRLFEGNPAAVCPLERWLDDALLQAIACENNLSETAFLVPSSRGYQLRWFTPVAEVDLCGHATLASAFVLFDVFGRSDSSIIFETRSGDLICSREGRLITMDFPARMPEPCPCPDTLAESLGKEPAEVLSADDYVAVYGAEEDVRSLSPDFSKLRELGLRGVVVTAPGIQCDFVSRFFAPKLGIDEDPVTGSAHCELAPYWSSRLGKTRFKARQLSRRGGEVACEVRGDRVLISGRAVKFLEAEIAVEM